MTNIQKLRRMLAEWDLHGSSGVLVNDNNQSFSNKVYSGQDPLVGSGGARHIGTGSGIELVIPPAVRKVVLDTETLETSRLNDGFTEFLFTLLEDEGLEKIVPGSDEEQVYVLVFQGGVSISLVIWEHGRKLSVTYKVKTKKRDFSIEHRGNFPSDEEEEMIIRTDTRVLAEGSFDEEGDVDPNKFPADWLKSVVELAKGSEDSDSEDSEDSDSYDFEDSDSEDSDTDDSEDFGEFEGTEDFSLEDEEE